MTINARIIEAIRKSLSEYDSIDVCQGLVLLEALDRANEELTEVKVLRKQSETQLWEIMHVPGFHEWWDDNSPNGRRAREADLADQDEYKRRLEAAATADDCAVPSGTTLDAVAEWVKSRDKAHPTPTWPRYQIREHGGMLWPLCSVYEDGERVTGPFSRAACQAIIKNLEATDKATDVQKAEPEASPRYYVDLSEAGCYVKDNELPDDSNIVGWFRGPKCFARAIERAAVLNSEHEAGKAITETDTYLEEAKAARLQHSAELLRAAAETELGRTVPKHISDALKAAEEAEMARRVEHAIAP